MDEIWDKAVSGEEITPKDRALVRMACAHAALESLRAVEIAYTLGGGSSIYEGSMLQRCLRDAHATTQHVMLAPSNYEPAGRALLGLDLAPMVQRGDEAELTTRLVGACNATYQRLRSIRGREL